MKLDDFTGGVTFDFRDLVEGWAGLATSTIAFLIAPDDVGPFWSRDLRTDQKVPQVLWPAKCNPVSLRDGLLEVVCLSVCLSVGLFQLSLSLPACLSVCVYVHVCLSVYLSVLVCLPVCLFQLSLSLSVCLSF